MIEAIDRSRVAHDFDLWAYVIMPEHVHLLISPTQPQYSISAILKSLKLSVSRKAIEFIRAQAPEYLPQLEDRQPNGRVADRFWKRGGGYDRNITEPNVVWSTMEYIHANPVRRGLCDQPLDWSWSSAIEWEQPGTGRLRIDRESVPRTIVG